jgi:hypothetical protein
MPSYGQLRVYEENAKLPVDVPGATAEYLRVSALLP